MSMTLYIEDLVANAFIELFEHGEQRGVLFKPLNKFGIYVARILGEKGMGAVFDFSPEKITTFLDEYSDYFYLLDGNTGFGLKQGITVEQLWEKFRGYLSYDVQAAFKDERAINALLGFTD